MPQWLGAFCTHVVIIIYQSVKALGSHVRVSTNKIGKSETFFFFGWFLLEWVDLNDELTTRIYYTRKTINKMHLNFTSSLCLYTFCLSCVVEHWSESWSLLHLLALTSSDKYWIILLLLLLDGKHVWHCEPAGLKSYWKVWLSDVSDAVMTQHLISGLFK